MAYRTATGGDTFLGYYLPQQLGLAATSTGSFAIQKLTNLAWYGGRLLWFSAPWGVFLIAWWGMRGRRIGDRVSEVLFPLLAAALVWPLMFSLSDRHADRYIFPAYYLLGAAGAIVGIKQSPRLRSALGVVDRLFPFEQVTLWALLTLLALVAWLADVPRIQL